MEPQMIFKCPFPSESPSGRNEHIKLYSRPGIPKNTEDIAHQQRVEFKHKEILREIWAI